MRSNKNVLKTSSLDASQQPFGDRQRVNSEAEFLGWQETPSGTVALYNITKENHPLYRSTVTEDTLRMNKLKIPQIPRNK
jgi:hypothetical protein